MIDAKRKIRSAPRDRALPLMVYVNEAERAAILAGADAAGMSVSAYLRALGTYRVPRKLPDRAAIEGLAHANADVGQLLTALAGRVEPEVLRRIESIRSKLGRLAEEIGG